MNCILSKSPFLPSFARAKSSSPVPSISNYSNYALNPPNQYSSLKRVKKERRKRDKHSVFASFARRMIAVDLVIHDDIEITRILSVGSDRDSSRDGIVRFDRDHIAEIEDRFYFSSYQYGVPIS